MQRRRPIAFRLNGAEVAARAGRDDHRGRAAPRRRDPAPVLHAGDAPRRQLPRVHGRDQGRARAGAVVLPRAGAGMEVSSDSPRAPCTRRRWSSRCSWPTCPSASTSPTPSSRTGGAGSASASRASPPRAQPAPDLSHPAMAVNLDACIQCTRCVRACREEQVNDVIGYAFRGAHSKIVFDLDDPMGESTCVACGECVQACPDRRARAGEGRLSRRRPTRRWRRSARIAASAASSPTTSRTTRSSASRAATAPPTTSACA